MYRRMGNITQVCLCDRNSLEIFFVSSSCTSFETIGRQTSQRKKFCVVLFYNNMKSLKPEVDDTFKFRPYLRILLCILRGYGPRELFSIIYIKRKMGPTSWSQPRTHHWCLRTNNNNNLFYLTEISTICLFQDM